MSQHPITQLLWVPGLGAYYREEVSFLQAHPTELLARYTTRGQHQTFLRVPSEILSIGAQLQGLGTFWGDAVGVAFAGKSGREKSLSAESAMQKFRKTLEAQLVGKTVTDYRTLWNSCLPIVKDAPLAFQYGFSQLCIALAAASHYRTQTEQWCREWNLPVPTQIPPFHGSCGADRFHGALKMMVHRLPSLPAGQGDNLPEMLGLQGEKLLEYAEWWKRQVAHVATSAAGEEAIEAYRPCFHYDVHGLIGQIFQNDPTKIAAYLTKLEEALAPYPVRIESPVVAATREEQIAHYQKLRAELRQRGSSVALVVDEWANTLADIRAFVQAQATDWIHIKMPDVGPLHDSLEAVLLCKQNQVGALLGGSCIETHTSAAASYQLALASQPNLVLLKPGMGFDEALSLAHNEMRRTLAAFSKAKQP